MSSSRREFLSSAGRVVVALPVGWAFAQVAACGGDSGTGSNNNNNNNSPAAPTGACSGAETVSVTATEIVSTSSCVQDHVHMVTLAMADTTTPPAGGDSLDTTVAVDHLHHVALSVAQLQAIAAGSTVSVSSTVANGHQHTFAFHGTVAAAPEAPAPPPPPPPPPAPPSPPSGGY